ncbi:MAG TPA: lytic transglycosylase domain-containing protein [Longimicrobiales bacterium]|nr:lytic transglycosylase domain-containing protein [Longimicrobiales bacterium]
MEQHRHDRQEQPEPLKPGTREVRERMSELDEAGAAPVEKRAESPGRGEASPDRPSGSIASLAGRHGRVAALGLAATSLAMLAGRSGPDATSTSPELAGVLTPDAETSEEKGVTWDLTVTDHDRVDFFKEFLMGKNYDKTRSWLERMGKYGPMIQNELRERGMPEDLLYLTMIESGLNPNAYSKAHAAGLWQFISETGQRYGLEVSTYVDERRDPVKSTAAALEYLQYMHERFDSWYLSAAGYNTGENRVGRLMRETTGTEKGTDEGYWDIWERLPRETRDYVPLMLAMGHIAKEPEKHGFTNLEYQEPLRFEEVAVQGGTRLSEVARVAGVDTEVIEDLNPHLVKQQTPPNRQWAVRVPVGEAGRVLAALGGAQPVAELLAD